MPSMNSGSPTSSNWQESPLEAVMDAAIDAIVTIDETGVILTVNRATTKLFGYDTGELVGVNVKLLMPSPDREQHDLYISRFLKTGVPRIIGLGRDVIAQRRDGSLFPASLAVGVSRIANGMRVFTGIIRDNSEHRRLADALAREKERAELYFDIAGVVLVTLDRECRVVRINQRGCRLLQYEEAEILGKNWIETVIPVEHRASVDLYFSKLVNSPPRSTDEEFENLVITANGEERLIAWRNAVISHEGVVQGTLSSGEDITDRRLAEIGLQRAHEQLEERVEMRTAELERANRELKSANTALSDFVHIASHDLKAPLRGISSLAQWLEADCRDQLDEEGRENLHLLRDRVRFMNRLIDDVLRFCRAGRSPANYSLFSSAEACADALSMLSMPESVEAQISLELPVITYDRGHFEQIIQNLVGNAIEHIGKPEGLVRITADEGEESWTFSIQDDGVGIDSRHFERIFKMFQSLDHQKEGSTGVGLAIVKQLVEHHGGIIDVESEVHQGSRFYFTVQKDLCKYLSSEESRGTP